MFTYLTSLLLVDHEEDAEEGKRRNQRKHDEEHNVLILEVVARACWHGGLVLLEVVLLVLGGAREVVATVLCTEEVVLACGVPVVTEAGGEGHLGDLPVKGTSGLESVEGGVVTACNCCCFDLLQVGVAAVEPVGVLLRAVVVEEGLEERSRRVTFVEAGLPHEEPLAVLRELAAAVPFVARVEVLDNVVCLEVLRFAAALTLVGGAGGDAQARVFRGDVEVKARYSSQAVVRQAGLSVVVIEFPPNIVVVDVFRDQMAVPHARVISSVEVGLIRERASPHLLAHILAPIVRPVYSLPVDLGEFLALRLGRKGKPSACNHQGELHNENEFCRYWDFGVHCGGVVGG